MKCAENIEEAKIQKRVRQGCALSPALLNIYIQTSVDEAREKMVCLIDVKVQGEKVDMLYFADDIAVLAKNEQELIIILNDINAALTTSNGMDINKGKTKVLVVSNKL